MLRPCGFSYFGETKSKELIAEAKKTCPVCLAMDGKTFPLNEPFPQHINCRCTMIPIMEGLPRRQRTIGKDWFENQDDKTKASIVGKDTFEAYRDNNLSLEDFVAFRNDKRFGKSVTRKPLAKILADKGIDPNESKFEELFLPKNIQVKFERGTKTQFKNLLGRKISDNEIGALVGALDNAKVSISKIDANSLFFEIDHPFIQKQQRTFGKTIYDDELFIHNDFFRTSKDAPKGTGVKSFTTQVLTAKKFGVSFIHTNAAGSYGNSKFNGYYTWARFGYNAPILPEIKAKFSKKFQNANDLNELMLAGGKDEWKLHGKTCDMIFLLDDGSKSLDILKNYLRERKIVVKF